MRRMICEEHYANNREQVKSGFERPLGRLAPFARAPILPKSRVKIVVMTLVSLKSTTRSTMASDFSADMFFSLRFIRNLREAALRSRH